MKKTIHTLRTHFPELASALLLGGVYLFALLFWHYRLPYMLDSDMASEMVLARLLCDENKLITQSWFYSTEVRVLNTQAIYALFFHFTDNWSLVRFLSNAVLYGILAGSTMYLCRRLGLSRSYALTVGCFPLLALCYDDVIIMLMGCYYIPHIAIMFLTLGLVFAYPDAGKKRRYLLLGAGALLAFLAGLGGIRQMVICYAPLMMVLVILGVMHLCCKGFADYRTSVLFRRTVMALCSTVCCGVGVLLNMFVLTRRYHCYNWGGVRLASFDRERFLQVLADLPVTFGFVRSGHGLHAFVRDALAVVLILLLFWGIFSGLRKGAASRHRFMSAFFLCDLAVYLALYMVTNMSYTARYNLPVLICAVPLIALGVQALGDLKGRQSLRTVLPLVMTGAFLLRGGLMAYDMRDHQRNAGILEIAAHLRESDYHVGFATFWNANVLTELTDGSAEMYHWGATKADGSGFEQIESPETLFSWLQKTSHIDAPPEGKVFAVYRNNEIPYCNWRNGLREEDVLWQEGDYTVYGYESYAQMMSLLGGKVS